MKGMKLQDWGKEFPRYFFFADSWFFRPTFSCFSLLSCSEEFVSLTNVLVSRVCALFGSYRSFGVSRFERV